MSRFTGVLLKSLGVAVLLLLVLSVVSAIISVVLGFVAAVVSLLITVAVLSIIVLAAFGLVSLLGDGDSSETEEWRVPQSSGRTRQTNESSGWRNWLPGAGEDNRRGTTERDPEKRLRERYVAGEIDEAEFERKMDLLLSSSDTEKRLNERTFGERGRSDRERDRLWER